MLEPAESRKATGLQQGAVCFFVSLEFTLIAFGMCHYKIAFVYGKICDCNEIKL